MEEITVDGRKYRLTEEGKTQLQVEREALGETIRTFTSEGELFWKARFLEDSAKGKWNEGMYDEGDETAPFFTEAFLYNLLGKDDARSVLGIIRRLSALAGVSYR